jgi:hypothetical protein
MATCSQCGCTISAWRRYLISGLCPECTKRDAASPVDAAQKVIASFDKQRVRCNVAWVTLTAAFFIGFIVDLALGNIAPGRIPFGISIALAVVFVCFLVGVTNWRCPACSRGLPGGLRVPQFCPSCGVQFVKPER